VFYRQNFGGLLVVFWYFFTAVYITNYFLYSAEMAPDTMDSDELDSIAGESAPTVSTGGDIALPVPSVGGTALPELSTGDIARTMRASSDIFRPAPSAGGAARSVPFASGILPATGDMVTIGGVMRRLPAVSLVQGQPAADDELTAWFLKNAEVHTGSSKIFEAKSKPVCIFQ
jgi:hypothetical protein